MQSWMCFYCAESMAGSHVLPVPHDRRHSLWIITVITHNAELSLHLATQQSTSKTSFTLKSPGKKLEILSSPCSNGLSLQLRNYIFKAISTSSRKILLRPYNKSFTFSSCPPFLPQVATSKSLTSLTQTRTHSKACS